MATPVVTETWAGNFDCDFCRRKRLIGDEFSKKALEKYRREGAGKLKCKQCVLQGEQAERQAAAARRAATTVSASSTAATSTTDPTAPSQEQRKCAGICHQQLDFDMYNRNQWNKGDGQAKCRACVDEALATERARQSAGQDDKINAARQRVAMAHASGNAQAIATAEAELAALQAEKVTGLKPIKMVAAGRGARGRGGRIGRSSGRGRARGGR